MKNSEVLDLYDQQGNSACLSKLMEVYRDKYNGDMPTKPAFQYKVKHLIAEHKKLKKRSRPGNRQDLDKFLDQMFSFPSKRAEASPSQPPAAHGSFADAMIDSQQRVAADLASELSDANQDKIVLEQKVASIGSVHAKCRVRTARYTAMKEKVKAQKRQISGLQAHIKLLQNKLKDKTAELKCKSSQITYLQVKALRHAEEKVRFHELEARFNAEECGDCAGMADLVERSLADLNETKAYLDETVAENVWLQDMANEVVLTKSEGQYTSQMKECAINLLSLNVSTGQVSPVIETVLALINRRASHLPSKSTINDWNIM